MSIKRSLIAICLGLALLASSTPAGFAQKLSLSSLNTEQDKAAIEKSVKAYAKALTEFPANRDPSSILRFHAREWTGIDDGKKYDLNKIQETLTGIIGSLQAGNTIQISAEAKDVETKLEGDVAWADYIGIIRVKVNGKVIEEKKQKCSDKFKRDGNAWLLLHSIATTVKEPEPTPATVSAAPSTTKLIDQTFNVSAGYVRPFIFHLKQSGLVAGRFVLTGNRFSDIKVCLVPLQEYDNFLNNRPYTSWYTSGKVVSGSIYVFLPPGSYALVFDNAHSLIIGAEVRAVIDLTRY
jgi:hypothetical protein